MVTAGIGVRVSGSALVGQALRAAGEGGEGDGCVYEGCFGSYYDCGCYVFLDDCGGSGSRGEEQRDG